MRVALWLVSLIVVLVAEGVAAAHSYVWAAPLICLVLIACAPDLPLVPFVGVTLLVRVLTDASLSTSSAGSGTVNLSGAIAVLLILVAVGLAAHRRQGLAAAGLAALWLCVWTAVALRGHGASTETVRQGVREGAVLALAVIVVNSARVLTPSVATRVVQLLGVVPAMLALYQLATHTGLNTEGHIRAYGTFNHPDGAAMFFAIAVVVSLWRYLESGRRRHDAMLALLFTGATVATFSLTGLASLLAMLVALGLLRPGSLRVKVRSCAVAGVLIVAFLATPYGSSRINNELSTSFQSGQARALATTSLGWRLYKWRTLLPQWERSPILGQGLGTTVTAEGKAFLLLSGKAPHNEYLRYLVETGVVGLGLLLWGVGLLVRRLARARRVLGTQAATLALAIVVGCLVNALADNTFLYTTTGYAAALVLAAALGEGKAHRSTPRDVP